MRKTVLFLILMACTMCSKRTQPVPPVMYMEYIVRNETRCAPFHCIFERDAQNRYLLTDASDCQQRTIEVTESFAQDLRQIIEEEQIRSYKPEYRSLGAVQDGEEWQLTIRFENSEKPLCSSGHQAQPKGKGLERIQQLCIATWND